MVVDKSVNYECITSYVDQSLDVIIVQDKIDVKYGHSYLFIVYFDYIAVFIQIFSWARVAS